MCYNPITIVNPTKYVSMKYRDRFLLRVPCGQCAQCQEQKKREYYFRAFYHAQQYLGNQGFVYFDTLTYAPKYLPKVSNYFPTKFDYPCFDGSHIRKFVAKLRQRCKRKYKSNFEFFLSSEYGSSEYHTHRPHYHILFFVKGPIDPLVFSSLVGDCWFYGRTDGKPYKSDFYVLNNVLNGDSAKSIRILKYVTKYISKSCLFSKEINKRVSAIMFDIAKMYPDGWLDTLPAAQFREKILQNVGQFHRQSTGFGASYLENLDINTLFQDGCVRVKDNERVVLSIPLPMYYKRKLFYEQFEVDGSKVWCPTELGLQYLETQRLRLMDKLRLSYRAALANSHQDTDIDSLVDYVVNKRGRIIADLPESTLQQRLENVDYYKYATRYDRHNFKKLGIVRFYLGNSTSGYYTSIMPARISLFSFGKRFSFWDDLKEKVLDKIDFAHAKIDKGKQQAYELRQRLVNLYHYLAEYG